MNVLERNQDIWLSFSTSSYTKINIYVLTYYYAFFVKKMFIISVSNNNNNNNNNNDNDNNMNNNNLNFNTNSPSKRRRRRRKSYGM